MRSLYRIMVAGVMAVLVVLGIVNAVRQADGVDVSVVEPGQFEEATPTQPFYVDETPVFPDPWPTDRGPRLVQTMTPLPTEDTVFPHMSKLQIVEAMRQLVQEEYPNAPVVVLEYADLEPSDGGGHLPEPDMIAYGGSPDIAILMSGDFTFHKSVGKLSYSYMIATVDYIHGRYATPMFNELARALDAMPGPE